jgi:cell division protein FtsB
MAAGRFRKSKKSVFAPFKQNVLNRLSNTDVRMRRNLLKALGAIVCIFLLWTFFSGDYGFIRMAKLHLKKRHLEKANHELLIKLITAEQTSKRLQSDYKYIEYIARTKHHLSKQGETIYRLNR